MLLENGVVFCLTATPQTIHHRITRGSPNAPVRPMLGDGDPLERIRDLLEERAPAYAQAHHAVPTDDRTPEEVADEVLRIYESSVRAAAEPHPPGGTQ